MTFDELVQAIYAILPDAVFSEDDEGEIVIATGFKQSPKGNLIYARD